MPSWQPTTPTSDLPAGGEPVGRAIPRRRDAADVRRVLLRLPDLREPAPMVAPIPAVKPPSAAPQFSTEPHYTVHVAHPLGTPHRPPVAIPRAAPIVLHTPPHGAHPLPGPHAPFIAPTLGSTPSPAATDRAGASGTKPSWWTRWDVDRLARYSRGLSSVWTLWQFLRYPRMIIAGGVLVVAQVLGIAAWLQWTGETAIAPQSPPPPRSTVAPPAPPPGTIVTPLNTDGSAGVEPLPGVIRTPLTPSESDPLSRSLLRFDQTPRLGDPDDSLPWEQRPTLAVPLEIPEGSATSPLPTPAPSSAATESRPIKKVQFTGEIAPRGESTQP